LPLVPSLISNLGVPGMMATPSTQPEVMNQNVLADVMREVLEPEEEPMGAEDEASEEPMETGAPGEPPETPPEEPMEPMEEPMEFMEEPMEPAAISPSQPQPAPAVPQTVPPVQPAKPIPTKQDREAAAIKKLVTLADKLDDAGREEEADAVDGVIQYAIKRFREGRK